MSDAEALADLIAGARDAYPRRPDDMDSEELADTLLASDWLAAYVAAERDRAVREALAPVRALADRWDALAEISEHDRAYVLDSVADDLRAALPDGREDHA